MNHKHVADNLSAYLDGRLDARQCARIDQHLAGCPTCRAELAELRQTVALLQQLPLLPVPRNFTLPASAQVQRRSFVRWNLAFGALRGATVAAALALFLFASGDLLFSAGILHETREAAVPQAVMVPQVAYETEPAAEDVAPAANEVAELAEPAFGTMSETAPEAPVAEAAEPQMLAKAAPDAQPEAMAAAPEAEPQAMAAAPELEIAAAENSAPPMPRTAGARAGTPEPQTRAIAPTAQEPAVAEGQGGGGPAAAEELPTETVPTATVPTALPPTQTPVPTLIPEPTATTEAQPERVAAVITPAPQEPALAPELAALPAEPTRWPWWRAVRYGAGLSLGLLVALSGLLLYAQRQRRA